MIDKYFLQNDTGVTYNTNDKEHKNLKNKFLLKKKTDEDIESEYNKYLKRDIDNSY